MVAVVVATHLVAGLAAHLLAPLSASGLLALEVAVVAAQPLLLAWPAHGTDDRVTRLLGDRPSPGSGSLAGRLLAVSFLLVVPLDLCLRSARALWQDAPVPDFGASGSSVAAVALLALLSPLCEELVFRGWLLRRAAERLGPAPGALVSALCFGAVHGQAAGATAMGFVLALLVQRCGSLRPAIAVHAGFNVLSLAVDAGMRRLHPDGGTPAEAELPFLIGGCLLIAAAALPAGWSLVRELWPRDASPRV